MQHERRCSRVCGEDVSFTDVKIKTPDRKWDQEVWMTSCTESVGWDLRKSRVEFLSPKKKVVFQGSLRPDDFVRYGRCTLVVLNFSVRWRRLTFRAHQGLAVGAARGGGGGGGADGKVIIERLCLSLPYVEKPFNSKVIKSFVTELRIRWVFLVFQDSYVIYIWVMNILCTFHISIYLAM